MADQPKKVGSRERVRTFLETHGLADEIVEFEQSTKTAADAADAMGCELGQIVKSLVVVVDGQTPLVALVAGDRKGDLHAIAAELGGAKAKMADADTVRAVDRLRDRRCLALRAAGDAAGAVRRLADAVRDRVPGSGYARIDGACELRRSARHEQGSRGTYIALARESLQ